MRKERTKGFVLGILVTLMLSMTLNVFAAPITRSVQIMFNNIKITLDGEEIVPRDARGNVVEPFILDGTTYLPVRGIAGSLGLDVEWDGATQTVILTTPETPAEPLPPGVRNFFDVLEAYETGSGNRNTRVEENQSFRMLGDEYANGLRFTHITLNWYDSTNYALYNLRGQHTTIKGVLGHIDDTSRDASGTLNIYFDNELYRSYPLVSTMLPTDVTLDVRGVNVLKFEHVVDNWANGGAYGFGNITIE